LEFAEIRHLRRRPEVIPDPGGGAGGGGGDKDCTILVRGKNGAALSKGNKLQFPYAGSRQVLGADDNKIHFGWKVEIIGRVLDGSDANDWKFVQTLDRVDSFLSFSGSWVSKRSSFDESLSGPDVYKNQVSGNTRYALDSPGLTKDSQLTTLTLKANFTTKFTNGESTCTAEWSMTLNIRNNVLMGAEWFDHHISLD